MDTALIIAGGIIGNDFREIDGEVSFARRGARLWKFKVSNVDEWGRVGKVAAKDSP